MTEHVSIRTRAKHDLIELADYIAQDSPEVAERFIDAAENTFDFLSNTPGAGSIREYFTQELRELRMWPIRGF